MPYHFKIDDPSGNSYVQNPHAPAGDVYVKTKHYERTNQDLLDMGFMSEEPAEEETKEERKEVAEDTHKEIRKPDFTAEETEQMMKKAKEAESKAKAEADTEERDYSSGAGIDYTKSIDEQSKEEGNINNEVFCIPMPCYQCHEQGLQKNCTSYIPHFKQIIIMAFYCEE
jgi:zinc finger protein